MTTQKQPRMFQSEPPTRHHKPAKPISAADALKHIQSYLESAQTCPYLHPDAIFSERKGPTYGGIASEGGLVLHQLRRVEAGLRGEILAADPEFAGLPSITAEIADSQEPPFGTGNEGPAEGSGGDDAALDAVIAAAQKRRLQELREAGELPLDELNESATDGADVRDWTDRSYNEQMLEQGEEGIVEGEIGKRNNVVSQEVPRPARKRKIEEIVEGSSPAMNKEARKRAKKERQKEEQKAREESRQQKAKTKKASSSKAIDDAGEDEAKNSSHKTLQASEAESSPKSRKEDKKQKTRSDMTATAPLSRPKKKSKASEDAETAKTSHQENEMDQDLVEYSTETDASSLRRKSNGMNTDGTIQNASKKKSRATESKGHEDQSQPGMEVKSTVNGLESRGKKENSKHKEDKAKRKEAKKRKADETGLGSSLNRQATSPEL